ncbi:hypothetical protein [Lysinibacillus sp. 54212]|uniref:hypothetical protein n=1 Tax=Lysinibacillus sp. 54212 TaxID=3119829 RepID=UPI002FC73B0D
MRTDITLLDAIKLSPGGPALHKTLKKTMELTGLNEEQISRILEPYSEKILSGSGLSDIDIQILVDKMLNYKK